MINSYSVSKAVQNKIQKICLLKSKIIILNLIKIKLIKKAADFLERRILGIVVIVKRKLGYKTTKIKFTINQSKKLKQNSTMKIN